MNYNNEFTTIFLPVGQIFFYKSRKHLDRLTTTVKETTPPSFSFQRLILQPNCTPLEHPKPSYYTYIYYYSVTSVKPIYIQGRRSGQKSGGGV